MCIQSDCKIMPLVVKFSTDTDTISSYNKKDANGQRYLTIGII